MPPAHQVPGRSLALLLVLLLSVLAPGSADAHPHGSPPPLSLDFTMVSDAVEAQLLIEVALAEDWLGEAWTSPEDPTDPEAVGALTRAFLTHFTLMVDDQPLTLKGTSVVTLLSVDITGAGQQGAEKLKLLLEAPVETPAQRLHLSWTDFSGILWEEKVELPVLVEADRVYDSAILTPEEHVFDWRRRPPEFDWSKPIAGVTATPPPRWSLPVPAIALGLLGLVFLSGLVLRRVPTRRRLGLSVLCLGLGAALIPLRLGRLETAPLWGERSVLPSRAQAEQIFQTLHENIYRAFANPGKPETEHEREQRIYAELATSVTPDLIEKLYIEILESLVLREQNGVIVQVDKIEKVDGKIEFPKEAWANYFYVDWHWKVLGTINHQHHIHRRMNVYRARYLVVHDGGAWRISSIKVREHRRIDENQKGELVVEQVLTEEEPAADEATDGAGDGRTDGGGK